MTQYEFEPNPARQSRNRYVGSWTEPEVEPIPLQFTSENLRRLVALAADSTSASYTHQQIARWCDRFWTHFYEAPDVHDRTPELDVAEDISAQWDMTIANTYSLAERKTLDYAEFRLPQEWFVDWLRQLDPKNQETG